MTGNQFFLFLIGAVIVTSFIMASGAFAEPGEPSTQGTYPVIDPVLQYYEDKQEKAKQLDRSSVQTHFGGFYVELPQKIECDNWIPVSGTVPVNGMLFFTVISGDFVGFHNVSHGDDQYLLNYFWLPCTYAQEAGLIVTFIYNEDDQEIAPDTKAKNLTIDKPALYLERVFTVQ